MRLKGRPTARRWMDLHARHFSELLWTTLNLRYHSRMQLQLVRDCVLNLVECCTGTKSTGTAFSKLYDNGDVRNSVLVLNLADVNVRILPAVLPAAYSVLHGAARA